MALLLTLRSITINLQAPPDTIYKNEQFRLQFKFPPNYPMDSPEVVFLKTTETKIPVHPHVYSNGHICLSILYDQWSPALTVTSVCLSILSMLSSCQEKEKPQDDEKYCKTHTGKSPKDTQWWFHGKNFECIVFIVCR